jgi:hypothetical protein
MAFLSLPAERKYEKNLMSNRKEAKPPEKYE